MEQPVRYIVHTADIHIGHPGRDEEYSEVFREFAAGLPPAAETLIVIAGDIFHHKTRYSGADVHLFNNLMGLLAEYPVVIIPGNHDTNMNNLESMDLITPVLYEGKFPNVHYLKYTGDYVIRGIKFYHVSVFGTFTADGGVLQPLTPAGIISRASKDTILLYHGMVNGVVYGTQVASERLITREVMAGFGAVMLGDIHEQQYLLPAAAYPGSLIQQNVAESQDKGYLVWDMARWPEAIASRRVLVSNTSGFVKLDFRGMSADEITALIESRPLHDKMLKISVVTDDASAGDALAAVEAKFGRIDVIKKSSADNISAVVVGECLRGLLKDGGMDETAVETCVDDYMSQVVTVARGRWYLRKVEWDNLFKYGPGNAIDFGKLSSAQGISGVIAGNHRGKSSIFDIIAFGLFNEHLRGKSVQDIIRKEATGSRVSIEFSTGGVVWRVTRSDTRARHTDLKLHRMDDGGSWVNCTSETAPGTYAQIQRLIGTFTQLMATGMYYDVGYELTNRKPADCLTMMTGLIGLDCNEKISTALDETITKLNKQIAGLTKPRITDDSAVVRLESAIGDAECMQSADEQLLKTELEKVIDLTGRLSGVQVVDSDPTLLEVMRSKIDEVDKRVAAAGGKPEPVEWRSEWAVRSIISSDEWRMDEELRAMYGGVDSIETKINELTIDTAVKTAAVDSLKTQVKARGNPDIVNKIPTLKAGIARLTQILQVRPICPTACVGVDSASLSADLAESAEVVGRNQPLPADEMNIKTLQNSIKEFTEGPGGLNRLKQSAAATAREHQCKIAEMMNRLTGGEMDLGVLKIEQMALENTAGASKTAVSRLRGDLRTVEQEALGMHIASLRAKSGMHFADGCTACLENKSVFCDGLSAAEEHYKLISAQNEEVAAKIDEMQRVADDASERLTVVDRRIDMLNELAHVRAVSRAAASEALHQIQFISGKIDGWKAELEAVEKTAAKVAAENVVRAEAVRVANATRVRAVGLLRELDAWETECKVVRDAECQHVALSAELATAESMLDAVRQYGAASAALKDITTQLTAVRMALDVVRRCESARMYKSWLCWDEYNAAVAEGAAIKLEYDRILEQHRQFEAHREDIVARGIAQESVDVLRRALTDRAVAIGVAQRDLAAASAEVVILRAYEREYPAVKNQLDIYKKYRAVVKSGGLKAGVVGRYLAVVVGRANDMLRTVAAGFMLTCGVDAGGVSFGFVDGGRELPLVLASGFQRFISALTFRMALITVLPASPSFIMIDEGFGCMDDENLAHAIEFLETCVLRDFEFVFVISHKEELRNTIRSPLCIHGDTISLLNNVSAEVPMQVAAEMLMHPAHNQPDGAQAPAQPVANQLGENAPGAAGQLADGRIQCECGALVMKKSLRAHCLSARHTAAMNKK